MDYQQALSTWSMDRGQGSNMRLIVLDEQGRTYEFAIGKMGKSRILLGRDPSKNDLVLSSPLLSEIQGCFRLDGNKLFFMDYGSKNGTILDADGYRKFIHGSQEYVPIKEGDSLRIVDKKGRGSILILYQNEEAEGVWKTFRMDLPEITIGRAQDNDIVISHPLVMRHHAEILLRRDGVILRDLGSKTGIYVNNLRVKEAFRLENKDTINIVGTTMIYDSGSLLFRTTVRGVTVEVEDVNKIVVEKKNFFLRKRKQILNEVNLTIESNDFVAIIGGSGAGKTTLMNAISCFDKKFDGNIYYNGIDVKANFGDIKDMMGFVPQEDIIFQNLTLRSMLRYNARLKMPRDSSRQEIEERIDESLEMVDLTQHQNTFIRKLSGGQKKRASIAVELLADPAIFFLDEPTSGLDPDTEKSLMQTLQKLSKTKGKTIIMVTHTTQSLDLCDKIIFLGLGGRLCHMGSVAETLKYFQTNNLVDIYPMVTRDAPLWQEKFREKQEQEQEEGAMEKAPSEMNTERKKTGRQFPILVQRYMELLFNDTRGCFTSFLFPVVIAFLLFLVSDKNTFFVYDGTKSFLFAYSSAAIWVGMFNSIQAISDERAILKREYMSILRLGAYVGSKVFVQSLLCAVQAAILTFLTLYLCGRPTESVFGYGPTLEILITIWLTLLSSMAMGLMISSLVKKSEQAMKISPVILIIQLLFSGILFKLEGSWKFISYVTISKWSVEALGSIAILNDLPSEIQKSLYMVSREANAVFESSPAHLFSRWLALLIITLVCSCSCLITLRNVSKDGR